MTADSDSAGLGRRPRRMPVIGDVLQKIAVARFTRTLGTLLTSGVPILDALDIVAKTAGNLIISEVNYNPHDALTQFGDADVDNDQFEYLELLNIGDTTIDLTGVRLIQADNEGNSEGIEFPFATQTIDPGQRLVVVKDRTAFASRYGNNVPVAE